LGWSKFICLEPMKKQDNPPGKNAEKNKGEGLPLVVYTGSRPHKAHVRLTRTGTMAKVSKLVKRRP
jgi:hypothetical protein